MSGERYRLTWASSFYSFFFIFCMHEFFCWRKKFWIRNSMKGVMSSWKCVPFFLFLLHSWHITFFFCIYKTGINHQNSPQLQLQLNESPINLKISLNCYKLDTSYLLFCCTPDIIIHIDKQCINHKKYTFNFQHESFTCKLRHLAINRVIF